MAMYCFGIGIYFEKKIQILTKTGATTREGLHMLNPNLPVFSNSLDKLNFSLSLLTLSPEWPNPPLLTRFGVGRSFTGMWQLRHSKAGFKPGNSSIMTEVSLVTLF